MSVLVAIAAIACLVNIANAKPEEAAQAAAEKWLAIVDDGKYDESWVELSATFKDAVGKRAWKSTIAEIRKPFGKNVSRTLKSAVLTKDLPGAPEGEYVVLTFESVFNYRSNAVEIVTPVLGSDLTWRVAGYSIK